MTGTLPRALAALTALAVLQGCGPAIVAGIAGTTAFGVAQERTTKQALTDHEIGLAVNARLGQHDGMLFRRLAVEVNEGHVILIGGVEDPADAAAAVEIARATPGVLSVRDEIVTDQPASAARYASDLWITTQVRARITGDRFVASLNYTVDTHDGVVHLSGVARSPRELERVAGHAAAVPGVRKVVSHVVQLNDPQRLAAAGAPRS